jgi:hypothetical protein
VARRDPKCIAVELEDVGAVGLAQPRRRLDQGFEHRLEVETAAADELEDVGGGAQRLLAVLNLGDVVTDRQHTTVGQGIEGELDQAAVACAPGVPAAVRVADAGSTLGDNLLDIDVGAIVAALRHVADAGKAGRTRPADLVRVCVEFQ